MTSPCPQGARLLCAPLSNTPLVTEDGRVSACGLAVVPATSLTHGGRDVGRTRVFLRRPRSLHQCHGQSLRPFFTSPQCPRRSQGHSELASPMALGPKVQMRV